MRSFTLALVALLAVPSVALAQLKVPHVTGKPLEDLKSDIDDLKGQPPPAGSLAAAIQRANTQPPTCDFGTFQLITPKNLAAVIQTCGEKLLKDSQAALDSATAAKDTTAISCLTPGTALIAAGVGTPGTPGTPEVPANPGNPTATPPVPATPEIPAVPGTPPQLGGPILLFQKYREFVNAGGISACESWVNTVVAAQVGSAASAAGAVAASVAGAAALAPIK